MSVYLTWCDDGQVEHGFLQSMLLTVCDPRVLGWNGIRSGPIIDFVRNRMVARFLTTDADWMLMVDADMAWTHDDFDRLMEYTAFPTTVPIVSGHYNRLVGNEVVPVAMSAGKPVTEGQGLVAVDSTGCGFLLVHREVFTRLPTPWFRVEWEGESCRGEDVTFCDKAREAGYRVMVDTDITVAHLKTRAI